MKVNNKLTSILNPKVIVLGAIGIIILIYVLFQFGTTSTKNTDDVEKILVKNEKPQSREFFEGYKSGKERASLASDIREKEETVFSNDITENTDDADVLLIQEALRGEKGSTNRIETETRNITYNEQSQKTVSQYQQQPEKVHGKVEPVVPKVIDTLPDPEPSTKQNRFFEGRRKEKRGNTLSCAVHGEQEIMNGSTLKLRLLEDYITPDGRKIDKGTTLWGVCTLTKERMMVSIESILIGKNLMEANLEAYDLDGLRGINLPNNVKAEIAKRVKSQSVQNAPTDEILDNNNGILEKSANTVANAAKNIISRKQEEIKITVKSNYNLLLKPVKK